MGLETESYSVFCNFLYDSKILKFIGVQLRRSDIFVAASAAEGKNAVGVGFCLTIIIKIPLLRSFIHFFFACGYKNTAPMGLEPALNHKKIPRFRRILIT